MPQASVAATMQRSAASATVTALERFMRDGPAGLKPRLHSERANVRRLVIGHTVQEQGINSACDGRVWRIDVGMSKYYDGQVQVLELRGDVVKVLKERPAK